MIRKLKTFVTVTEISALTNKIDIVKNKYSQYQFY